MNPKVSVIIPTYNRGRLVKEAIESVLRQSFNDFEVLVIDDGSTDNTRDVVGAITDKRVCYFYKENGGVASTRNFGAAKARGDLIAFLDSDDLWPADYLSAMASALYNAVNYGVAYCAINQIRPDGRKVESYRAKDCVSGWITRELFHKSFIWCQAAVFRKGALSGFYWDEALKTSSDVDALLRISRKTEFLFVKEVEVTRRVREDSISVHSFSANVNCDKIRVMERFCAEYGAEYLSRREEGRRLSHVYKETAKRYYNLDARKASIYLFKRAISYDPLNIKAYKGLIKALLGNKSRETMPEWQMSAPLPEIK